MVRPDLTRSEPGLEFSSKDWSHEVKTAVLKLGTFEGLIVTAAFLAAAVGGCSSSSSGNPAGSAGGDSSSSTSNVVGTFTVALNPADASQPEHTTIFGTAYTGPVLSSVIQTLVENNSECKVFSYSQHSCVPACLTTQTCVAANTCKDNPSLAGIGDATMTGIGSTVLKLSNINKNYQYAGDIIYPGFAEGDTITLSATGDTYPAFDVTAKGIAPVALGAASYMITKGAPLELKWTPGSAAVGAKMNLGLNISKHGGSAGYLSCDVSDTGSYTIPATLITALIELGVAGFPQLTVTRTAVGEEAVSSGVLQFRIQGLAIPSLQVEGYCSCFNDGECGTCSDKSKTVCDTVKKLCHAP